MCKVLYALGWFLLKLFIIHCLFQVEVNDGLPQNMCTECINYLKNYLKFRKKCRDTEVLLLKLKHQLERNEKQTQTKIKDEVMEIKATETISTEICNQELDLKTEYTDIIALVDDNNKPLKYLVDDNPKEYILCVLNPDLEITETEKQKNKLTAIKCEATDEAKPERISNKKKQVDNDTLNDSAYGSNSNNHRDLKPEYTDYEVLEDDDDKPLKHLAEDIVCLVNPEEITEIKIPKNETTETKCEVTKTVKTETSKKQELAQNEPLYDPVYSSNSKTQRVTCKLCQKELSIRSIGPHMDRNHPGADGTKVKCELCDNYVTREKMNRHLLLMHGSECYRCGVSRVYSLAWGRSLIT